MNLVTGKQVFVVDDDESVCDALCVLLGTYGFSVRVFNSANAFFRAVPESDPGCLVLDLHMPELDGWAALNLLRDAGSARPVIIITADKKSGLKEKIMGAGAAGFLHKPFNDQELVDLIGGMSGRVNGQ